MVYKVGYPAFVGGEVAPTVRSRVDQEIYFKSLLLGRNCYTSPQGWTLGREGQQFIDHTPSGGPVRLVSFEFGDPGTGPQAYLLEFSQKRMRVFKNDALVADYDPTDDIDLDKLTYAVVDSMGFTASADTLILTHISMQPLRITRTSDTTWTFAPITFKEIPTYAYNGVVVTQPATTLTPSATGGEITLTAGGAVFSAGSVGQYVVINRGLVRITEYTSTTVVTGLVVSDLSSATAAASGKWDYETGYEPVWSVTRGWPALVAFFRGRLYLAGGARPQTGWASKVGDFFNMDQGDGEDDDAFEFTLDDDGVNAIINLYPGRTLQIFTTGGEFFVRSSTTKPITPKNIVDLVERASRHGSERVRPVDLDGATLYLELDGYVLRDYIYDDVQQSYTSEARSDLASHLIKQPVDMAVRQAQGFLPFDHVFLVNSDGTVALMNSKKDPKVDFSAWNSWDTQGKYERVAVVNKQVYFAVQRTLDSGTVRSIEKLNPTHYLDYSKSATSVSLNAAWTGFNHLAGETAYVRGDGFNLQYSAVSGGGAFTSSDPVLNVEAGLEFKPRLVPMPPDIDIGGKTMTGDWRKTAWVNVLVENCDEIMVKVPTEKGTMKTYRPPWRYFGSNLLDQPIPRRTGWVKVFLDGVSQEPQLEITQPAPGRFQVLSMQMGVA